LCEALKISGGCLFGGETPRRPVALHVDEAVNFYLAVQQEML